MVMKMKKIERGLKNSAKRMFDDAAVKERVRAELCGNRVFEEVAEPVAIAGGRTVRTGTDFDAKKKITLITALVLIACLAVSLTCYFMLARGIAPLSDTYIALDINPSFGITAGEDDIVTEVTALNEDAAVVLYGMELAGLTVDEAVTKIVAECELLGYLDAEDGETRILAVNSNSAKESAVANGVVSALGSLFRENAWGASVRNIACANPSCTGHCDTDAACIAANQAAADTEDYDYTYRSNPATRGKSLLAEAAVRVSGLSEDSCLALSPAELWATASGYVADSVNRVVDELETAFNSNPTLVRLSRTFDECEHFVSSLGEAMDYLTQCDGKLTDADREAIRSMLAYEYEYLPDINAILDIVMDSLLFDLMVYFQDLIADYRTKLAEFAEELDAAFTDMKTAFIATMTSF